MVANQENTTLTPKLIIENFQRAYKQIHGQEPQVIHMFAEWYQVNGETVHRLTLFSEITRLRELAQRQRMATTDRGIVHRLIAKLRGV